MKKSIIPVLLSVLLFTACEEDSDFVFDRDLRGTWVSNDPSRYSGTLVISRDRITITGYDENQTPPLEDDTRRPFRSFPKGVDLSGYSENGHIHITDAGQVYSIPYIYSSSGYASHLLRFTFGDRVEILQR